MANNIVAKVDGGDNIIARVTTTPTIKAILGNALIVGGGGGQIPELSAGATSPVGTVPATNPHLYIQLTSPEWTIWLYTGSTWQIQADTGKEYLSQLLDVNIPSPQNGQVLGYNSTTSKWEAQTVVTTTTNTLTNPANTITSTVNGVAATASAVNTVSNTVTTGAQPTLTTTVNGVTGAAVNLPLTPIPATTNTLTNPTNTITSTVNGVSATAQAVNTVSLTNPTNTITASVNGVSATATAVNTVVNNVTTGAQPTLTTTVNGVVSAPVNLPTGGSGTTTNTLTNPVNTITSTVNGVAATAQAVNTVTLANPVNTITSTVNGVSANTTVINTNTLTNPSNTITSTVNGVSANATVVNTVSNTVTTGAQPTISTTVNGVTGAAINLPLTPIPPTTNTLSNPVNTLTSTVDGVAATATVVNTVVNTVTPVAGGNQLTTAVNGVTSTAVTIPGGGSGADTAVRNAELEPTGFPDPNRTQTTIAFNNATRTFTITPTGASFDVWVAGTQYTKTAAESIQIPNTSGLYYIAYNTSGQLVQQTVYFIWDAQAPVAYIYWNATDSTQYFFADERHGTTMDWATHEYLHRTRGAAFATGYNISGTTTGTGALATDVQIGLSAGTFFDEDIEVDYAGSAVPANTSIFYLIGSLWKSDPVSAFPVKAGTARARYNANTAGVWGLADLDNNEFGVMWICATNDATRPIISIMGQAGYPNISQAEAAQWSDMNLTGLPIFEMRVLWKLIFETSNQFTNSVKAVSKAFQDWRTIEGLQLPNPSIDAIDLQFREYPQTVFQGDATAQASWQGVIQSYPSFAPRYDVTYDCVDNNSNAFVGTLHPDETLYAGIGSIVLTAPLTNDSEITGISLTWQASAPTGLVNGSSVVIFSESGLFNITAAVLSVLNNVYTIEGAFNCIHTETVAAGTYPVYVSGVITSNVSALNNLQGRLTLAGGNNISITQAGQTITINNNASQASQGNSTSFVIDQEPAFGGILGYRAFVSNGPSGARAYYGMGLSYYASEWNTGGLIGTTRYIQTGLTAQIPTEGFGLVFPQATTYTDIEVDVWFPGYQMDVTVTGLSSTNDLIISSEVPLAPRATTAPDANANQFPPFRATNGSDDVGLIAVVHPKITVTSLGSNVYRCVVTPSQWRGVSNNFTLLQATTSIEYLPYLAIIANSGTITAVANVSTTQLGGVKAFVSLPGVGGAIPNLQQVTNQGSNTSNVITLGGISDSNQPATSSITYSGNHADVKVDGTTVHKDPTTGTLSSKSLSWGNYTTSARYNSTVTPVSNITATFNGTPVTGTVHYYEIYDSNDASTPVFRFVPTTDGALTARSYDSFWSAFASSTLTGLLARRGSL